MDYVEAVTQASTALKRGEASNWLLAQLTHDHTEGRAEGSPRVSDLIHVVSRFASETQRLLGEMGQLPEPDADAFRTNLYLTDAYRRAEVAMEAIGALLRTGVPRQDIEDFFKRVVSRER
jgi:hypothetical protein